MKHFILPLALLAATPVAADQADDLLALFTPQIETVCTNVGNSAEAVIGAREVGASYETIQAMQTLSLAKLDDNEPLQKAMKDVMKQSTKTTYDMPAGTNGAVANILQKSYCTTEITALVRNNIETEILGQ